MVGPRKAHEEMGHGLALSCTVIAFLRGIHNSSDEKGDPWRALIIPQQHHRHQSPSESGAFDLATVAVPKGSKTVN